MFESQPSRVSDAYHPAAVRKPFPSILAIGFLVFVFLSAPTGVRSAQGKAVGPPEVAWKDLTFDQKRAYMKSAVVPR